MNNLFARIRELLPLPPVLVGIVREIHDDYTSTVEIPGALPLSDYSSNVATGSLIRARGTSVPVGKKAFVRAGVIETQAPDGDAIPIAIGTVIVPPAPPPPPPPPAPAGLVDSMTLITDSAAMLHYAAYGSRPVVTGTLDASLSDEYGAVLTNGNKTVTFGEIGSSQVNSLDWDVSGNGCIEIAITDIIAGHKMLVSLFATGVGTYDKYGYPYFGSAPSSGMSAFFCTNGDYQTYGIGVGSSAALVVGDRIGLVSTGSGIYWFVNGVEITGPGGLVNPSRLTLTRCTA